MNKLSSIFAAFAVISVFTAFVAPVEAGELTDDAHIETAGYATYTPAMAARGQRFYVGP